MLVFGLWILTKQVHEIDLKKKKMKISDGTGVLLTYLVHADISTLLHISDWNSSFFETAFKTKAAAQIETHHAWPWRIILLRWRSVGITKN